MQLIQSSPSGIIHCEKYPFHNTVTSFPNLQHQETAENAPFNFFLVICSNKGNWSFNESDLE